MQMWWLELYAPLDHEEKSHPAGWDSGELEESEVPADFMEQVHSYPSKSPPDLYFLSLFLEAEPSPNWYDLSGHHVENK